MKEIRVAIAEDQQIVREGIAGLLKLNEHFLITQLAANGLELLNLIEQAETKPHVILMDIEMPIMNGYEATQRVLEFLPHCKVIFLTSHHDQHFIDKAIKCRGHGYLLKNSEIELLYHAIEEVHAKGYFFNELMNYEIITATLQHAPKGTYKLDGKLTLRELDFVRLVCQELSDKQIAQILNIGVATAQSHRKNILKKIGVKKSTGIILYAIRENII